jgi:PAS domain S-box-containing protein
VHDGRTLEEEASALARQLNDTLESIGDAVLSLDTEWRVTFVNAQGERLLQHTRSELVGRNVWMTFPEAIGSVFQQEYERAVAERRPVTFGAPFAPLDIYAEVSAYPHDGGLTIYFRDVSEHRSLTEAGVVVHDPADSGEQ